MPDAKRVIDFEDTAAHFGYSLGIGALPVKKIQMKSDRREHQRRGERGHSGHKPQHHEIAQEIPVTPQMYQRLTARIAGKPEERILAYLMLRSLKQARYSEKNEGHFALAAIVKALLAEGANPQGHLIPGEPHAPKRKSSSQTEPGAPATPAPGAPRLAFETWDRTKASGATKPGAPGTPAFAGLPGRDLDPPIPESELAAIAQETSQTERRAAEAERELIEWKKIKFMRDRVGEDFDALILNATKYGLFVELDNLFVEGLVPIDSLRDDHYTYRENTREIIGSRHHRKYFMGQKVRVILDRIDSVQKRLQFTLIEEDTPVVHSSGTVQSKKAETERKKAASKSKASLHPYRPPKQNRIKPKKTRKLKRR
jgi:ribonuclease R